jgi:hypothetical protein
MEVVRQERPGIHDQCAGMRQVRESAHEVLSITVIPEDGLAIQAPRHHVM